MTEERCVLKIDSEFRRLIFPYTQKEYDVLEQKILQEGCNQPIIIWYGYIVQGFEQYNICMAHNIRFEVKNINFRVREEVISTTCREELRTRYLPENQYRYLIGKRYNADIIIGAHSAAGTDRFKERIRRELSKGKNLYESSAGRTRERLAEEYHLNRCSIVRYSTYAQAIDYIASIKSETADRILAGKMKKTMEDVMAWYGKAEDEVIKLLATSRKSINIKKSAPVEKKKNMTIKDMPAFDPDAEINSLALTIPSWINTIDRTRYSAKFPLLTEKGRNQLEQELYQLQKAAQIMLHSLKEAR